MERSRSVTASALTLGLLLSRALAGCGSTTANGPAPAPSPTAFVERDAGAVLDTRLEITNKTGLMKKLKLWAGCLDANGIFEREINAVPISAVGYCGASGVDVGGEFGTGVGPWYTDNRWINYVATNPKVGFPSISIDGFFHRFATGETCAFKTDAGIFEAERRPDRSGAKDLALTWVTSTTIPTCD